MASSYQLALTIYDNLPADIATFARRDLWLVATSY